MEKRDIKLGFVVGVLIALLSIPVLGNLGLKSVLFYLIWVVILPFLTLLFLYVAGLFKTIPVVSQIAKFVLIGALNTFVDLGVLNVLILFSSISSGIFYSVFKGISFGVAVVNSYFFNKTWTFKREEKKENGKEFILFFLVSLVGFAINVGVASFVVNVISRPLSISANLWANIGALSATLFVTTWNFLGYKFLVFK